MKIIICVFVSVKKNSKLSTSRTIDILKAEIRKAIRDGGVHYNYCSIIKDFRIELLKREQQKVGKSPPSLLTK